jgi:hypothetical protein
MPENLSLWIGPFAPVLLMLVIVIANHAVAGQRNDKKTGAEASRLSAALAAEVRAVLELYRLNLELIEQKANYLLSTRSSIVVYRSNLARLTMLDTPVLEQVVGAFAQNERIEAIIAAQSTLKSNFFYQFSNAEAKLEDWKKMYEQASRVLVRTCCLLDSTAGSSAPLTKGARWQEALDGLFNRSRDMREKLAG